MGRISDALAALRGEVKAAVPGAETAGNITTVGISPAQIEAATAASVKSSSMFAAALDFLAENFSEPACVALRNGEPDPRHPLSRAFAHPTPFHSQTFFWQRFAYAAFTDPGGAYIVAALDAAKEIATLWVRNSSQLRPVISPTEYISGFEFMVNGIPRKVDPDKYAVLWFRFPSPDPADEFRSFTLPDKVLREVRTSAAASLWIDNILQHMGVSSGAIGIEDDDMSPVIAKDVQERVNEQVGGATHAGQYVVLSGKVTVHDFGMDITKLDFGALSDRAEIAIARASGIPAELLQTLVTTSKGTGLNASEYREKVRAAYDNKIIPLWKSVADAVAMTFGPLYGLGEDEVAFDTSGVQAIADDLLRTADIVSKMGPYIEPNEGRERLGLPPKPWGNVPPTSVLLASRFSEPQAKSIQTKSDKHARAALWERKAASYERSFESIARSVFDAEAEDVRKNGEAGIDPRRWEKAFGAAIAALVGTGGVDVYGSLGGKSDGRMERKESEPVFDIYDPRAVEAAARRTVDLAGYVTDTTMAKIRAVTARAVSEGLSPQETADLIASEVFGGDVTKARAMLIARTETLHALNEGGLIGARAAMDDLGLDVTKEWLTAGDAEVRDTHSQAEAAGPQPLDSDFGVGAQFPGDFGDASEDANCRCVLVYEGR